MNKKLSKYIADNLMPDIIKLYFYNELICPNCERKVPNKDHFIKKGCKWCQKS